MVNYEKKKIINNNIMSLFTFNFYLNVYLYTKMYFFYNFLIFKS